MSDKEDVRMDKNMVEFIKTLITIIERSKSKDAVLDLLKAAIEKDEGQRIAEEIVNRRSEQNG